MTRSIRWKHTLSLLAFSLILSGISTTVQASEHDEIRNHVNKGNYFLSRRQFQDAIREYEEALRIDPSNQIARGNIIEVHNNWGIYYYAQKKYGDALFEWEKCLELDPGHRNARRNISLLKQMASQQGLDLSASDDAGGGGNPDESDRKPPPKTSTNAKSGGAIIPKSAPKEEPAPSGAVMILTPGIKQPSAVPTTPGTQPSDVFGATAATSAPEDRRPLTSPSSLTGSTEFAGKGESPLFPVMPVQKNTGTPVYSNTPSAAPPESKPTPTYSTAPAPTYTPPAASKSGGAGGSLEDQLTSVEMKVYGKKQEDLTVLQRLEKMEKDTSGSTRSGTIMDRIDYLKQSFGL